MYYVLDSNTETVIAMCYFVDVAYEIANSFPSPCVVRYAHMSNSVYAKDTKFFTKENEKTA